MSSYVQTVRSYLSAIFGVELTHSSSSLNQVVQLYTWILFLIIPALAGLTPGGSWVPSAVAAASVFVIVGTIKIVCYKLHQIFDNQKPQVHIVPEQFPLWCAVRDILRKKENDDNEEEQQTTIREKSITSESKKLNKYRFKIFQNYFQKKITSNLRKN